MKISFDRLFKSQLSGITTYILYGNDESVIERALSYLKQAYEKTHVIQFLDAPGSIHDNEPSLFQSAPRPTLSVIKTSSEKVIQSAFPQGSNIAIFIAPNLRAKSSLVMASQSQSDLCTISCYECALIPEELMFMATSKGLTLSQTQLRSLYTTFKLDFEGLSNILFVLALYESCDEEEFKALIESISHKGPLSLLLPAIFEKNIKAFDRTSESEFEPETMIPLLRSLARSFEILLSQKAGLSTPPYPIFFKDQPLFQGAQRNWSLPQIQEILKTLLRLENDVKFKHIDPHIIQQSIRPYLQSESH
ncbi:DNA polymerase III subunit delta [Candidatus Bealeia paramacronuclearis]|uniref:DNA polymerase III subunit delta n=1 Tax=Candidatus Bealeia paramacronuclearis TaxID=1921001 RepID=A0ABZ2C4G8_9PROT|nr:DNA polymerase III subunit delta [Candidatus Bealeia paramacronuclearis]